MSDPLTIQQVSQACGVNPVTLRAWERRYGLIKPGRTGKGHRRYGATDLARIRRIQHWLERGVPIGQVAPLLHDPDQTPPQDDGPWGQAREEAMTALSRLNSRQLEALINRLVADYGHQRVIERFCGPLRQRLRSSPALAGRRAMLENLLVQKWGARALSLAPKRGQFGWMLIPVGPPLAALELAMTLNRPLWCLHQTPTAEELAVLVAERPGLGVLWVIEDRPTTRQAAALWGARAPCHTVAAWGPAASLAALPSWLPAVGGEGETLAAALDERITETTPP